MNRNQDTEQKFMKGFDSSSHLMGRKSGPINSAYQKNHGTRTVFHFDHLPDLFMMLAFEKSSIHVMFQIFFDK